ncbi:MAG: LysR family transcriptional regulator, partial [Clostridia bacterium]|nr:LysR family transcriptional regulator [Clostridia bacterium]
MNILHLKYAVEVARIGSIKKTAEILFNTQPNLSRCIRELETSVGITIFDRTTKGMVPTPEGEHFLR